jgi:hypothetical protein
MRDFRGRKFEEIGGVLNAFFGRYNFYSIFFKDSWYGSRRILKSK